MTTAPRYFVLDRILAWIDEPVPVLRLELVRIFAPLAILGFMSSRIAHADEWLGKAGFRVPDLGHSDYRQPVYLPALPDGLVWAVAIAFVVSGLAVSFGFEAKRFAILFAAVAMWVTLSDRLSSFSVSKLAPMIGIALAVSPCGRRFSIDSWRATRRKPKKKRVTTVRSGTVRFFQLFLPTVYCASGIAKARGDWLKDPYVLWSHLHDTYQTSFTVFLANLSPAWSWTLLQALTLIFEAGAPLWFAWQKTRVPALVWGVAMHAMIGLMFGPVRWFAMLMATILVASFAPAHLLERAANRIKAC